MADEDKLLAALKFHFSYESFRPNQKEAIQATLGGRDSLLILPTGGGKSMTFQLPALAKGNCFTVVVGPLMALAKDQVDSCLDLGIDARVWNSDTSEDARKQVLSELVSDEPEMRLLYTTPESLRNPTLRSYLKEAYETGTLLSFAIDEAHCVSDWGHDFRPAYLELSTLKTDFPNTPIAAMTASCTSTVETGIVKLLCMKDPLLIKGGFNRPNIQYKVVYKELIGSGTQDEVVEHLVKFIQERQGQGGIIYARLRATCDWLCSTLNNCDLDVGCYHAGKDTAWRRKVQQDWCEGGLDVVVATIAFGMGIDRADVRWVVHWDVPSSLEGFYQESGRAGRDALPSESVMYVSADDLDTVAKLEKGNRAGSAAAVASFSCQPGCRRRKLLDYFGQKRGPCDASQQELFCDYCSQPQATRREMEQWEQTMCRKAVQHTLRQQRQEMSAEEDGEQQQQHEEGNTEHAAGSNDGDEVGGQQPAQLKLGLWGSAAAQCTAGPTSQQQVRPSRPSSRLAGTAGVLRQSTNMHTSMHTPAEATPGSTSSAAGVQLPQQRGPAVAPQIMRKRAARQPLGGFKAPRMMQDNSSGSSSVKCQEDGSERTHLQQPAMPEKVAEVAGCSNQQQQQLVEQQQQAEVREQELSILAALETSPAATAAGDGAAVGGSSRSGLPDAGQQRGGGAGGTVLNLSSSRGRQLGRTGRQAFVPPLKRS